MSKEEGGGGGGGESQAQYVGPYRLEKTLGKGQTGEWSFIQAGETVSQLCDGEGSELYGVVVTG